MADAIDIGADRRGASAPPTRLACLIIVGRAHGLNLTVAQLIRENLLGAAEPTTDELLACARGAGLRCTALPLDWSGLLRLDAALPAIVMMRDGAAQVITAVLPGDGGGIIVLRDPNGPLAGRTVDRAEFIATATGDVILLRPDHDVADDAPPFGFRAIAAVALSDRRLVRDMIISAVMLSVLALTPIVFWTLLSADVLPTRASETFLFLCAAATLLVLFEGAFSALRRYVLGRVTTRVDTEVTTAMFDRLLSLPIEVFETTPIGGIVHVVGQMAKVRGFLTGQLFVALLDAGVLLIFLPVMAFVSPLLTLVVFGFCAAIVAWLLIMLPIYRRRSIAVELAETARGALLSETVNGIRTVRTLGMDPRQTERWDAASARVTRLRLAEADLRNVIQSVVTPLDRLSLSGTIAVGAFAALAAKGSIGVGALLTFVMLTQRVAAPLMQLSTLVQQYDEARNAVDQIGALLNQPAEEGRSGHGVRSALVGAVSFAGVRFSYRGTSSPALRDVSFTIPPGTTFGIMGRSGSGKTTITRLLQRLHADYTGSIRIDGVEVREYDVDHLRASLGVVLQDNFLFSGTIRDNIAAARSDATPDEVVHAARLSGAEEFIDKLPGGYETIVYEGSPNLSGGQRQRLAIARALITDPRVLILDEATSALDAESEAIVNTNLRRLAAGRTTIVISHRLSSLVACDAILVLDEGEAYDIGTHRELLDRCDIYAGLWARQNAHAAAPAGDTLADGAATVNRLAGGSRG